MSRGPLIAVGVVAAALTAVGVAVAAGDESDGPTLSGTTTTVVVEAADEYVPDHSRFKFGNEALIVDGAVEPLLLEASIEEDVVITNATDEAVTIRFLNGAVGEAQDVSEVELGAGDSFRFRETYAHSIAYQVNGDEDWAGSIRVDYQRFGEEG